MGRVVPHRRRRGFVLTTLAVTISLIMACVGLTIDAGYLELVKTRMQIAADAAAIGGAQEIRANGQANVVSAAKSDAASNGFTDGAAGVKVVINNPPATGYSTTDGNAVEAIVSQTVSPIFMGLIGIGSTKVIARSVAHRGTSGGGCMYTIDPSASGAFTISGGVQLAVNCGIVVDSNSPTAMSVSGGTSVTAPSISEVGGYSISGGSSMSPLPGHTSSQLDPLAYVQAPATGSCGYTNYQVSGGASKTLSPGVYCNGISLSGGATVTLNPGVYVLMGGGLSVSGGAVLTGAGVTFYNTGNSTYGYSGISISGGTTENLSAPTTGSLAGILFFQDRTVVGGASSSFSGGAMSTLVGALYFPTTDISYSGGVTAAYTIIVSRRISFSGGATLNSDYSSLPAGSPVKGLVSLSE